MFIQEHREKIPDSTTGFEPTDMMVIAFLMNEIGPLEDL